MPAKLNNLRFDYLRNFVITSDAGEEYSARNVLLLLNKGAGKDACQTVTHNSDAHAIRHNGVACVGDEDPFNSNVQTYMVFATEKCGIPAQHQDSKPLLRHRS